MQNVAFEPGSANRDDSKGTRSGQGATTRLLDPSFMLAVICTGIYYGIMLQPAMHGSVLARYTTEHAVEYGIVFLFVWGVIDICLKCARFPREFNALRQSWLPPCRGREPVSNSVNLLQGLRNFPRWQQESKLGRCLRELLEYIAEQGSAKDVREHHRQIVEREEDRVNSEYTLLKFIVAVTPILGFLGTVVHFGTALSGMSFDEMTEKLPVVVSEMGMAFNTTTVALAVAMVTMFSMFLCERTERGITHSVDRFLERELVSRFEGREQAVEPFLRILQSAHESALEAFSSSMTSHFDRWAGKVDALLERFDAHQDQAAGAWQNALISLQQQHLADTGANESRWQETLQMVDAGEQRHLQTIQRMLDEAANFREELASFSRTLENFSQGEGKLAEVQESLSDNLLALQRSGQIDAALHGLTAAIHLLTVRHNPGGLNAAA